jgi:hypothetical protein
MARRHFFQLFGAICFLVALSAKGQLNEKLQMGGGTIAINIDSPASDALRRLILQRLALSAKAVTAYYQRYPVEAVSIRVRLVDGHEVNSGRAFGWPKARISLSVGRLCSPADFAEDWQSTHEMVHLAFPSVAENHHWIEEGLATYVEPIARARIGELKPEKVWGDMIDGMPKGMPEPGDRGLDFTPTWGRTYWGGALFCLIADVEIRKQTGNKLGLENALRGILSAGGNIETEWTLERALQTADQATGVTVLQDLYNKMKASAVAPDLKKLWHDLGIERRGEEVVFDDSAPLAPVRKAITQGMR